jgi:hypothetical protein
MMTKYGAPPPDAYVVQVPLDAVNFVIGRNEEMLKFVEKETGAKVYSANKANEFQGIKNVFIEGRDSEYRLAK